MSANEETLVLLARKGDRAAFEELVRRTSRLVFVRLYLETNDRHRAEDLLQDTYLLAFRSLDRLAEPAGFRAWLLTIAHNVAFDAARRAAPQANAGRPCGVRRAGPPTGPRSRSSRRGVSSGAASHRPGRPGLVAGRVSPSPGSAPTWRERITKPSALSWACPTVLCAACCIADFKCCAVGFRRNWPSRTSKSFFQDFRGAGFPPAGLWPAGSRPHERGFWYRL